MYTSFRVDRYLVFSKRFDKHFNIQFFHYAVAKTFQVVVNEKVLVEREGKFSAPNFFPIYFHAMVGNRTVKFTITGCENGVYEFEVHGVMYDTLKSIDDPDANDSLSEEEKAVDMSLTGWIKLNDISVFGTGPNDL